jgi:hypothetical protein
VLNGKEQKWGLGHWNGTEYDFDAPTTTADVTYDAGVLTFSINKSELGNTAVFAFYVWAGQIGPDDKTIASDDAPDGSGVWEYTLTAAPKPLVLTAGKPVGKPARPQSGKAFLITVPVRRSDTGRPATSGGTIACKATVGAKAVKAAGRFSPAGPQCVVRVPAKSSGKTLRGTITVTIKGAKVTKAFAFRVA